MPTADDEVTSKDAALGCAIHSGTKRREPFGSMTLI